MKTQFFTHNSLSRITLITLAALTITVTAPAVNAGLLSNAKSKVSKTVPKAKAKATSKASEVVVRIDQVRDDIRALTDKVNVFSKMGDVAGNVGDGAIGAIVDSVQPLVELVHDRQRDFQAFNAEGFRYELAEAVDNIAYLQTAIIGDVGPGIAKLQSKVQTANPVMLFAMSESPLTNLLEKTQGMGEELRTVVKLTMAAEEHVRANLPEDQARRIAGLGMSISAPEFVSCTFVMDNVNADDITNLKLSRLRAKQISGVASLALKVLPKSQTIGVNVVGGATVSIPNPVTPMTVAIQRVADKYYDVSKKWSKKYDTCKRLRLNTRLQEFLEDQGYPLVD